MLLHKAFCEVMQQREDHAYRTSIGWVVMVVERLAHSGEEFGER